MTKRTSDDIRAAVRAQYGAVARRNAEARGSSACSPGCCSPRPGASRALGYDPKELASVPEGVNLGLGCGNPGAHAKLRPGEVVLDLGSGAGFDCFLAAKRVGRSGRVIGVDMTPDMVAKARANAEKQDLEAPVEFRLGEIERLPVADTSVDVILSNCVVNLSPEKRAVFAEAARVSKPGGRLAISDVVATASLPDSVRQDLGALTGCVAGAADVAVLERLISEAGFEEVRITVDESSRAHIAGWMAGSGVERYVASARIEARMPPVRPGRRSEEGASS